MVQRLLLRGVHLLGSDPLQPAVELEQVVVLLDEDPFWTESLIVERSVEQWNPVLGVFA